MLDELLCTNHVIEPFRFPPNDATRSILRQTQTSIRPTKSKAVSKRNIHLMLLRGFRNVVAIEVPWRITRIVQVERGRHYSL